MMMFSYHLYEYTYCMFRIGHLSTERNRVHRICYVKDPFSAATRFLLS